MNLIMTTMLVPAPSLTNTAPAMRLQSTTEPWSHPDWHQNYFHGNFSQAASSPKYTF